MYSREMEFYQGTRTKGGCELEFNLGIGLNPDLFRKFNKELELLVPFNRNCTRLREILSWNSKNN